MGGAGSGRFGYRGGRVACESRWIRRIETAEEIEAASAKVEVRVAPSRAKRPSYFCPRCDRVVRVLYELPLTRIGCLECLGLTYRSRQISPAKRFRQTADRLLARHGIVDDDGMCYRPHGMHRRTFDRVMDRVQQLESMANHADGLPAWLATAIRR